MKIGPSVWPGRSPEKKKKKKKKKKLRKADMSPPRGGATADPIRTILGSVGGLGDVITHTMFEVDRLTGVEMAGGGTSHA